MFVQIASLRNYGLDYGRVFKGIVWEIDEKNSAALISVH